MSECHRDLTKHVLSLCVWTVNILQIFMSDYHHHIQWTKSFGCKREIKAGFRICVKAVFCWCVFMSSCWVFMSCCCVFMSCCCVFMSCCCVSVFSCHVGCVFVSCWVYFHVMLGVFSCHVECVFVSCWVCFHVMLGVFFMSCEFYQHGQL